MSDELAVITFDGNSSRNKVIKALECSNTRRLKFIHSLADKKNSENIILPVPANNIKLYKELCKLRKKKECQMYITRYSKAKKELLPEYYRHSSYDFLQNIQTVINISLPKLIGFFNILAKDD